MEFFWTYLWPLIIILAESVLMLVVLLLVAGTLAWRRRGGLSAGKSSSRLRTLAITPIGPRDRLLLIECDSQRFLLAQGPAGVAVRVSDNGPGVPAEEHARLFRRLYRREASRTQPGYGLGLSLAQAIAE